MEEFRKLFERPQVQVPKDQKHLKKYYFAPNFSLTI